MDSSSAGTVRGFGRGAIIEQMQKLAASRLNQNLAPVSSSDVKNNGSVRGSGRGQLLDLLSRDLQSLPVVFYLIYI